MNFAIGLLISRSVVSGLLPERLGRSVAAFDHFFLPRLHRKGFVAPDRDAVETGDPLPGGDLVVGVSAPRDQFQGAAGGVQREQDGQWK